MKKMNKKLIKISERVQSNFSWSGIQEINSFKSDLDYCINTNSERLKNKGYDIVKVEIEIGAYNYNGDTDIEIELIFSLQREETDWELQTRIKKNEAAKKAAKIKKEKKEKEEFELYKKLKNKYGDKL